MQGTVTVGNSQLSVGSRLMEMIDSTAMFRAGDFNGLRARLAEEGFLLIRGLVDKDTALGARRTMLEHLQKKGALKPGTPLMEAHMAAAETTGWTVDAESGGVVGDRDPETDSHLGWAKIGNCDAVTSVYNGDALRNFYHKLFADPAAVQMLPHCTWLRMKGKSEVTAEHCDYFYFRENTDIFSKNRAAPPSEDDADGDASVCQVCHDGKDEDRTLICDLCDRGFHMYCTRPAVAKVPEGEWHCTDCANSAFDMYTCWTSLSDIKAENGALAVFPKSQTLSGYERPINKLLPHDYGKREKKAVWQTTSYGPGDIVFFNIKTIHGATKNTTSVFRLSCDTRVAASRFVPPFGPHAQATKPAKSTCQTEAKRPAPVTSRPVSVVVTGKRKERVEESLRQSTLDFASRKNKRPRAEPGKLVELIHKSSTATAVDTNHDPLLSM